jgi:GNAT-like C-terminal domain/N-acyltransferase N-terminal domain
VTDLRSRLTSPELRQTVQRLEFRGPDVSDVLNAAASAAESAADLEHIDQLAQSLRARIGNFDHDFGVELRRRAAGNDHLGVGVLPLLALTLTAHDVVAFHARHAVPSDISWHSLADLGQQAWVHRQTYGGFGLHTFPWMSVAWSGAMFWLGRLQFNLQRDPERSDPERSDPEPNGPERDREWLLSTHIPATGPLTPESVDDSFRRANRFFAEFFPEYKTSAFHCCSWLLDPELAAVLPPDSNMAQFQQRWERYGEPMRSDADALFFTFYRRGDVDLDTLPRETTLQRALIDRLKAGQHWNMWNGRISQAKFGGHQ